MVEQGLGSGSTGLPRGDASKLLAEREQHRDRADKAEAELAALNKGPANSRNDSEASEASEIARLSEDYVPFSKRPRSVALEAVAAAARDLSECMKDSWGHGDGAIIWDTPDVVVVALRAALDALPVASPCARVSCQTSGVAGDLGLSTTEEPVLTTTPAGGPGEAGSFGTADKASASPADRQSWEEPPRPSEAPNIGPDDCRNCGYSLAGKQHAELCAGDGQPDYDAAVGAWWERMQRTWPDRDARDRQITEDAFHCGWEAARRCEAARPFPDSVQLASWIREYAKDAGSFGRTASEALEVAADILDGPTAKPCTAEAPPAITHVAIRWNGQVWSLPRPFRHHNIIRTIATLTGAKAIDCSDERGDQGFLDASGRYLSRVEALPVALANKQVLDENDIRCGMLFSEDVWLDRERDQHEEGNAGLDVRRVREAGDVAEGLGDVRRGGVAGEQSNAGGAPPDDGDVLGGVRRQGSGEGHACDRCGARNATLKNEHTFLFCFDRAGCDARKAGKAGPNAPLIMGCPHTPPCRGFTMKVCDDLPDPPAAHNASVTPLRVMTICPICSQQHIDEGEWATRPHKTHRCVAGPFGSGCGREWKVANVATVGVRYDDLDAQPSATPSSCAAPEVKGTRFARSSGRKLGDAVDETPLGVCIRCDAELMAEDVADRASLATPNSGTEQKEEGMSAIDAFAKSTGLTAAEVAQARVGDVEAASVLHVPECACRLRIKTGHFAGCPYITPDAPSPGSDEERRIEERLVVTDLCDLHAFEKNENNKRRLRRAINFIEGRDCFPKKCPACFADKPCPASACEHPDRVAPFTSKAGGGAP